MSRGLHLRLLLAEIRSTRPALLIFVVSVGLSITALVALGSLRANIETSVHAQSRALIGGDIQIRSSHEPSPALRQRIEDLARTHDLQQDTILELLSMVSVPDTHHVLLCQLKVVSPAYPLYGTVLLRSGRRLSEVLLPGQAVAEEATMARLHLRRGDRIQVGSTRLTVVDVLTREPDRALSPFALGPRIMVARADLTALHLVLPGSNVTWRTVIKTTDSDRVATVLRPLAWQDHDQLDTWETAATRLQTFFDRLLSFLTLTAMFTMVLAGLGIQSTLSGYLAGRRTTMAVLKSLGATHGFLLRQYGALVSAMTVIGLAGGTAVGLGIQFWLPRSVPALLGHDLTIELAPVPVGLAILTGAIVAALFTSLPLRQIHQVRPKEIFSPPASTTENLRRVLLYPGNLLSLGGLSGLICLQVHPLTLALEFVGGLAALCLLLAALAWLLLAGLARRRPRPLVWRQALCGLYRPGNRSQVLVTVLATALSVIVCLLCVETSLQADFVAGYPPDAPNLFLIDIQPDQVEAVRRTVGLPTEYYPIVRARIRAINDVRVPPRASPLYRKGELDREVRLTWRDHLLADETVVGGGPLFPQPDNAPQVSIVEALAEDAHLHVGDRLTFIIAGVDVRATVVNLRSLRAEGLGPDFEFVLNRTALQDAPQTWFTAVRVPEAGVPALQEKMSAAFPNVSSIDVQETIRTVAERLGQLNAILHFFTAFSVAAGLLILIGSLLSTQAVRIQEAVYYKILGARRGFVVGVLVAEHALLGVLSAVPALTVAEGAAWLICREWLDIDFHPAWGVAAGAFFLLPTLLVVLSLAVSGPVLREKPANYLRQHEEG